MSASLTPRRQSRPWQPGFALFVLSVGLPGFGVSAAPDYGALARRSDALLKQGKVAAAIPYLKVMVKAQPYNEGARYLLALALLQRKDLKGAAYRQSCLRAARLLERSVRMHRRIRPPLGGGSALALRYFYLGMAYWYADRSGRALSAFESSYRAFRERTDALYNRYAILEEQGKTREAETARKRYLKVTANADVDD